MTAAIILAAGASSRMGTPKALLPFRGTTFLNHLALRLAAFCQPVIAVTGAHAGQFPETPAAVFVHNAAWRDGQLSSLQCGLRALPAQAASALFTLVDHPDPAPGTIERLVRTARPAAIPVFQNRRGHPVFLRAPLIAELLALPSTASAKLVLDRYAELTDYIPVDDPAILDDIDDPAALARFLARTEAP